MIVLILDNASNILANGTGVLVENDINATLTVTSTGEADRLYILNDKGAWIYYALIENSRNRRTDCRLNNYYLSKGDELILNINIRIIN